MDLDLIKKEIENKKREKQQIAEQSGIDVPMAKDNFLHSLQESLATGRPNKATQKLKVVTDRSNNMEVDGGQVINKNKIPVNEQVLETIQQPKPQVHPNQHVNPNPNPQIDPREEQFYKNLQETKQLLGNNNVGMADAMQMYMKNQPQQPQMINSQNALNEAVQREVKSFMSNIDFPKLVEDIVKSTMMEMYQKEKLEKALNENQDKIQKMVVNTIIALQKRKQQKK
jgi:hypothetical protein